MTKNQEFYYTAPYRFKDSYLFLRTAGGTNGDYVPMY